MKSKENINIYVQFNSNLMAYLLISFGSLSTAMSIVVAFQAPTLGASHPNELCHNSKGFRRGISRNFQKPRKKTDRYRWILYTVMIGTFTLFWEFTFL